MITADHRLKKFNHDKLEKIIAELELPGEVKTQIQELTVDIEIIDTLKAANQLQSAIKFLVYGLPVRETIWWAYINVAESFSNQDDVRTKKLLYTVEAWVKNPLEATRRLTGQLADELGLYTALGWLGTAVFWSGGSITPADQPAIEPAESMCHNAVINAVIFAANASFDKSAYYEKALKRGLHIAMGGNGRVD